MRTLLLSLLALAACAQTPAPTVDKLFTATLTSLEHEFVPLVEAMPAEKLSFAPTQGEFKGVRTFSQQATHAAAVIYAVASATLKEKNPTEMGADENGPANLKTKEDVVAYVKAAFAYAQKAGQSLTADNLTELVPSPFGSGRMTKLSAINVALWHTFDHYGQMVIYARINGVVPPASRR